MTEANRHKEGDRWLNWLIDMHMDFAVRIGGKSFEIATIRVNTLKKELFYFFRYSSGIVSDHRRYPHHISFHRDGRCHVRYARGGREKGKLSIEKYPDNIFEVNDIFDKNRMFNHACILVDSVPLRGGKLAIPRHKVRDKPKKMSRSYVWDVAQVQGYSVCLFLVPGFMDAAKYMKRNVMGKIPFHKDVFQFDVLGHSFRIIVALALSAIAPIDVKEEVPEGLVRLWTIFPDVKSFQE